MAAVAVAPSMPRAELSDGELVEAHLAGESQAFEILFRRHHDRLVRFCWKQTQDHELAEDLAQEAMIRCLQKAEMFDTSEPLWPWLQTVARNITIDHYRRTSNDPFLDPDLGNGNDASTATTIRLDRVEERSELGCVLGLLPKRQRLALELHHGEDWTTADLADYLDIKVNACKQLLYRARNNARKYYEDVVEGAESALSIVFVHPLFLAIRDRYQRSRSRIEALATDVAGLTIALDAVAERALAALAVIGTVALGGMNAASALEFTTSAEFDSVSQTAKGESKPTVHSAPSNSSVSNFDVRSPVRPGRNSRAARFATGARTSIPGLTSMSGNASYERSGAQGQARQNITIEIGSVPPVFDETVIVVPCDDSSVAYQAACDAADAADDVTPGR